MSFFWAESYGQIYPILRTLVSEGLATSHVQVQTGKPNRHVYTITGAGQEELRRWLSRPVEHEVGRVEILLKLFFGWQLPVDENLRKVEEFRGLQRQLLSRYEGIEQWLNTAHAGHPGLPYWLMTLSYGQHVSRALLDWCDETVGALESMKDGREDGAWAPGLEERS